MTDQHTKQCVNNYWIATGLPTKTFFFLLIVLNCLAAYPAFAQEQRIADSLARIYKQGTLKDTARLDLLLNLSFNEVKNLQQALKYSEELISLARQATNDKYIHAGYFLKGTKERLLGNLDVALDAFFKSAEVAKKAKYPTGEGDAYGAIADIYSIGNNHSNAISYYNKAIATLRKSADSVSLASALLNAGDEFRKAKKYDTALLYFKEAALIFDRVNYPTGKAYSLGNTGMAYAGIGKHALAEININDAIQILEESQDYYPICDYLISMADIYLSQGDTDAALKYALRSVSLAEVHGLIEQVSGASLKLSELYEEKGNAKEALKYFKQHVAYRDSINNISTVQKMADLRTNYEVSQKQVEVNLLQQQKRDQKNLAISLGIILFLSILILGILMRNNKSKQKAYANLNLQKKQTDEQKSKAEAALTELQITQKQLIQSAKMVSLGELTAGIAHEIQNPLNFVNNFAEVSVELLAELREETTNKLSAVNNTAANEIINVLTENLKKITDHGKRADSIVKGMLQHSRTSTGNKEPTDINALADEYLRLSYHGLRAKDKTFNATFTTHFDETLHAAGGRIETVPQDLGRVLLNLYNNAFYAVNKKKSEAGSDFVPLVTVTTKRKGRKVFIAVRDNGTGIPKDKLDKLFQPFFTTKPTGQGTGLGLSLSYDIIKALGGDITVNTQEAAFAEFIIQLPVKEIKNA